MRYRKLVRTYIMNIFYVLETEGLSYPRNEHEAFSLFQRLIKLQNQ